MVGISILLLIMEFYHSLAKLLKAVGCWGKSKATLGFDNGGSRKSTKHDVKEKLLSSQEAEEMDDEFAHYNKFESMN